MLLSLLEPAGFNSAALKTGDRNHLGFTYSFFCYLLSAQTGQTLNLSQWKARKDGEALCFHGEYNLEQWPSDVFITNPVKKTVGTPGWHSQLSIKLLISAQVMISGSWDQDLCWTLCWVWSLLGILSLPLPLPLPSPLSLSLKKNYKIWQ